MNSAPNPIDVEPRDALTARMDQELTHAYEKIKSVDAEIARASEQLSRLKRDDANRLRADGGRPALRGIIGLTLAAGICAAAFVSQSSYGDTARQMIADWIPLRAATLSPSQAEPVLAMQPGQADTQPAQAQPAPPPPAPAAQASAEAAAPTVATLPPELTGLLDKMASDLASVQQGIEQLKATQEQIKANQQQMSVDNLRVADELKASQEQVARLVADKSDRTAGKAAHQAPDPDARHGTAAAAAPPRPAAIPAHRPAQTPPAPHSAVRRPGPVQLESAQQ